MWFIWITLSILFLSRGIQSFNEYFIPRCSEKLEYALENVLQRNNQRSGSASTIMFSPYNVFHSKSFDRDYYNDDSEENLKNVEKAYKSNAIEVTQLRARVPSSSKWVRVDKCIFNQRNQTLDTKLVFPDLQISGRVTMVPNGGRCNMILRLRRAEIELITIPLAQQTFRMRNVRTESHFTEPGFISVFAHGCQGPTGIRFRNNSKRRNFDDLYRDENFTPESNSREHYDHRNTFKRSMNFEDDFFLNDEDHLFTPCCESSSNRNRRMMANDAKSYNWEKMELVNNEELEEGFSREIEDLFSNGVRSLLTTYMQKALQPAIKETLMESMGYKLSYG